MLDMYSAKLYKEITNELFDTNGPRRENGHSRRRENEYDYKNNSN